MAKSKNNFYAVKNGRKPGIYTSWDECKRQVMGFSGAVYKGFETEAGALGFMSGGPAPAGGVPAKSEPGGPAGSGVAGSGPAGSATAYVDGSYLHATREYACGVVFFHNGNELRMAEKYSDPALAGMRNVAGEIKGAEKAMRHCLDNGIEKLTIFHDYEGIARWCTGEWKANKPGTQAYKAFYDSLSGRLSVTFAKVKGHSGDTYNDAADELAKSALGLRNG